MQKYLWSLLTGGIELRRHYLFGYAAAGLITRTGLLTPGPLLVRRTPSHWEPAMLLGCEIVFSFPGKSNDPTVRLLKSD